MTKFFENIVSKAGNLVVKSADVTLSSETCNVCFQVAQDFLAKMKEATKARQHEEAKEHKEKIDDESKKLKACFEAISRWTQSTLPDLALIDTFKHLDEIKARQDQDENGKMLDIAYLLGFSDQDVPKVVQSFKILRKVIMKPEASNAIFQDILLAVFKVLPQYKWGILPQIKGKALSALLIFVPKERLSITLLNGFLSKFNAYHEKKGGHAWFVVFYTIMRWRFTLSRIFSCEKKKESLRSTIFQQKITSCMNKFFPSDQKNRQPMTSDRLDVIEKNLNQDVSQETLEMDEQKELDHPILNLIAPVPIPSLQTEAYQPYFEACLKDIQQILTLDKDLISQITGLNKKEKDQWDNFVEYSDDQRLLSVLEYDTEPKNFLGEIQSMILNQGTRDDLPLFLLILKQFKDHLKTMNEILLGGELSSHDVRIWSPFFATLRQKLLDMKAKMDEFKLKFSDRSSNLLIYREEYEDLEVLIQSLLDKCEAIDAKEVGVDNASKEPDQKAISSEEASSKWSESFQQHLDESVRACDDLLQQAEWSGVFPSLSQDKGKEFHDTWIPELEKNLKKDDLTVFHDNLHNLLASSLNPDMLNQLLEFLRIEAMPYLTQAQYGDQDLQIMNNNVLNSINCILNDQFLYPTCKTSLIRQMVLRDYLKKRAPITRDPYLKLREGFLNRPPITLRGLEKGLFKSRLIRAFNTFENHLQWSQVVQAERMFVSRVFSIIKTIIPIFDQWEDSKERFDDEQVEREKWQKCFDQCLSCAHELGLSVKEPNDTCSADTFITLIDDMTSSVSLWEKQGLQISRLLCAAYLRYVFEDLKNSADAIKNKSYRDMPEYKHYLQCLKQLKEKENDLEELRQELSDQKCSEERVQLETAISNNQGAYLEYNLLSSFQNIAPKILECQKQEEEYRNPKKFLFKTFQFKTYQPSKEIFPSDIYSQLSDPHFIRIFRDIHEGHKAWVKVGRPWGPFYQRFCLILKNQRKIFPEKDIVWGNINNSLPIAQAINQLQVLQHQDTTLSCRIGQTEDDIAMLKINQKSLEENLRWSVIIKDLNHRLSEIDKREQERLKQEREQRKREQQEKIRSIGCCFVWFVVLEVLSLLGLFPVVWQPLVLGLCAVVLTVVLFFQFVHARSKVFESIPWEIFLCALSFSLMIAWGVSLITTLPVTLLVLPMLHEVLKVILCLLALATFGRIVFTWQQRRDSKKIKVQEVDHVKSSSSLLTLKKSYENHKISDHPPLNSSSQKHPTPSDT